MTTIRIVHTNIHGGPVNEDHHWTVHSDAVVDRARAMRRDGMAYRAIGKALGVHFGVVWSWCSGRRRKPSVRVVARRYRSEQSVTDHQSSQKHLSYQQVILDRINLYRQINRIK